jgi:hypothetical protein
MSDYSGNKIYKQEKRRQESFKKSEENLDKNYKKVIREESRQEGLNRLHPEDSTVEPEFAKGGIVGKGQGRAIKTKLTKLY